MYAETDFLLALIKEDDWLAEPAEAVYGEYRDELWTSSHALVELILVAYREGWDVLRVTAAAKELVAVEGDVETVLAAASYVEDEDLTPFDALHLAHADGDPIVSSDTDYDGLAQRVALEERGG